jgi:hypothetical protein
LPATVNCGNLVVRCPRNKYLNPILEVMREIGCPYRELNAAEVKQRLPIVTLESFDPPRRPEDAAFGTSNGEILPGAVFFPTGGLCHRSPACRP